MVAVLALLPLELEDAGFRAESWRTSSRTRLRRAGKVTTSPERRRDSACDWIVVGQFVECEFRACRRASCILREDVSGTLTHGVCGFVKGGTYLETWPSRSRTVLICERRSWSRVACVWFAALEGTLTGVEGELFDMMAAKKEDGPLRKSAYEQRPASRVQGSSNRMV